MLIVNASPPKYTKQSGLGIIGRFAYATNLVWCPTNDPWYGGIINIYLTVTSMVADLRVLQSSELCQVMTMKLEVPVGPARSYGACFIAFIAVDTAQETTLEMPDSARALAETWLTANTISMVFNYIWRMAIWATFKIGDVPMQAQAIAMIWQKLAFREEGVCQLWSEIVDVSKKMGMDLKFSRWFASLIPRFETIAAIISVLIEHNAVLPWRYGQVLFGPYPIIALYYGSTAAKILDWMRRHAGKVVAYRDMSSDDAQTMLVLIAYMIISTGDVTGIVLIKNEKRENGSKEARAIP